MGPTLPCAEGRAALRSAVLLFGAVVLLTLVLPQGGEAAIIHSRLIPEVEELPSKSTTGETAAADAAESTEAERDMQRAHKYGMEFIMHRTDCTSDELSLISTEKHGLWYSEDGSKRKRFRTQGYDARGYEVTRELPLRIGNNWHLVFSLNPRANKALDDVRTPQTHHITVFEHIVGKELAVTQHTWKDEHSSSTPQSSPAIDTSPFVLADPKDESLIATFVSTLSPLFSSFSVSADSAIPSVSPSFSQVRANQPKCKPLKTATFNIWNFNEPWEKRLKMINEHMLTEKPDVVGWQEVRYDISQRKRAQFEQLIKLPVFKGYQFVWERGMTYLSFQSRESWHVDEGVAVFSRFPIVHSDRRILSRDTSDGEDRDHQRVCLRARIRPLGCRDLDFLVTHLTLSNRAREKAVLEIAEWIASFEDRKAATPHVFPANPMYGAGLEEDDPNAEPIESVGAVLVGDMNTEPGSRSIDLLLAPPSVGTKRASFIDAWTALHPTANSPDAPPSEQGLSFPTWKPRKRIDCILVKRMQEPEHVVRVLDVRLMGNVTLRSTENSEDLHRRVSSDHLGLWALLDLPADASAAPSSQLPSQSSTPPVSLSRGPADEL